MASLLRQIVAGPRAKHPEAGLDLCYVTDHIIATSGPSQTYPQRAYRNPLDQLVAFLDAKHGRDWAIWEFRAEGTGYPDDAVYGRVRHYPWPDHHPPPFRLVPLIMASMRNWLHGGDGDAGRPAADAVPREDRTASRVVVVHCKAGKGRSGTAICSYLIAEEGWTPDDALARFTQRRMRPKFGAGVTIPSQLRWIGYVDRWTKGAKKYVDQPVEVLEIHVWGLRHGVKVDVEGFVDDGRRMRVFHTFTKAEMVFVEGGAPSGAGFGDMMWELAGYPTGPAAESAELADGPDAAGTAAPGHMAQQRRTEPNSTRLIQGADKLGAEADARHSPSATSSAPDVGAAPADEPEPGGMAVILRPSEPIRIPNSDVNIAVERRNRTHKSMGLTVVSAVAHVWFNAFFDGGGPERHGRAAESGVFAVAWDAMDGIKGSSRKGARALDRLAVVWRAADPACDVPEPPEGQPVPQALPADWAGPAPDEPNLGVRAQSPAGADLSRASSVRSGDDGPPGDDGDESMEGVQCSGPSGGELLDGGNGERV